MTTTKQTTDDAQDGNEQLNFEQALERLEKIVAEMEAGSLSLEKMTAHFEEGQKLVGFCSKKLNEVERKIEKLVKKGERLVSEPLDAEP